MEAMTSGASVRAWAVMSAADSASSRRSRSPRTIVKCPRSSATSRDSGRSQRLSSSSLMVWGAAWRRSSITRSDAADNWCASSTITRREPVADASRRDVSRSACQVPSAWIQMASSRCWSGQVVRADPAGHPERLAGARGGDKQGHRPVDGVVQSSPQPGARHIGLREPGWPVRPGAGHGADVRLGRRDPQGSDRTRCALQGPGGGASHQGRALLWCKPGPERVPKLPLCVESLEPGHTPSTARVGTALRTAAPSSVLRRGYSPATPVTHPSRVTTG